MGNSSSSTAEGKESRHHHHHHHRPPLRQQGSATSTATIKSPTVVREARHDVGGKRRKSIELPDLDPSLHLTPASGLKGAVLPPEATKPSEPEAEILLGSHAHEVLSAHSASSVPFLGAQIMSESTSTITSAPLDKPDSSQSTPAPSVHSGGSLLPPLHPPSDTIVAPQVPVVAIPLGAGASATTASIVGSPWASGHNSPVTSPPVAMVEEPAYPSDQLIQDVSLTPSLSTTPVYPGSLGSGAVMPVIAPLATLTALNNPAAVEAVKAATVDLGAGAEGVPTLLTWTPGPGEGQEGGQDESGVGPGKVFVTGTFAKGWTTKIELRRKESHADFSALVNLPPGPHSLKFIVDEQWKTSRNLPSATDPEGNLINYLQVTKSTVLPPTAGAGAPGQLTADEERWMKEEAQWTNVIPDPLLAFGDATEAEDAALEAHEEHNRILIERGEESLPMLDESELASQRMAKQFAPPPQLPAQLQRGVLNFGAAQSVGSGDDHSILPKPDHTVIDHLAASPISRGLLSVGVTKRYRRRYVTTVLYKPVNI